LKYQYFLNKSSKKLHKINGCCHSKAVPSDAKKNKTLDDALKENTRYMSHCKLCFRETEEAKILLTN